MIRDFAPNRSTRKVCVRVLEEGTHKEMLTARNGEMPSTSRVERKQRFDGGEDEMVGTVFVGGGFHDKCLVLG